jgi:hypothetical protein
VSIVGLLLITAGRADAQIVTISNMNFVADPPPKANPQGTWSVPANSGEWKVIFDYGTVNNGTFTLDVTIGIGGTVFLPAQGGNGNWGPVYQVGIGETLKNPLPAGTHVRAQLLKKVGGQWQPQHTTYAILPVQGGGGGGE